MSRARRFIAVAGNMGAGKTELVDFLCRRYGLTPVFEPNDENPYLEDFYADMSAWAFHSQVWFLARKVRLQREIEASRRSVVQDRTLHEDAEIFARNLFLQGHMSRRDWETYQSMYRSFAESLRPPDLMIYLRAGVRTLRKRIRRRGRPEEQAIPTRYLQRLNRLYEDWIDRWALSDVLVLETDRMDYLQDLEHRLDLLRRIEGHLV